MTTFALIGATGTIGSRVLATTLTDTKHQVNCFVRSKSKLSKQLSTASLDVHSEQRVKTFEGDMTTIDALGRCIEGTAVVFLCAAATRNVPGCKIAQDQAQAVVSALRQVRASNPDAKPPKLVMLSSAECSERFSHEIPAPVRATLFAANSYIYNDLIAAERYLRDHDDLVSTVFVKPGGLSHDIRRGHQLSTETHQTYVSFLDLAAGMVEIADTAVDGEKWDGKSVSVLSPSGKAKVEWSAFPELFRGLLVHFFPWLYAYIR